MKIRLEELNSLISDLVQVGFMSAIKAYEPSQDSIRASEVKKWLKMMYIDCRKFNVLVSKGIITAKRHGEGKNSPLYYSKKEIKQALVMAKIDCLITKDMLNL